MVAVRKIVVCLLLALWLPATLHCSLENLPGLEFLACTPDSSEDSHCGGEDGCNIVESGAYKLQNNRADLAAVLYRVEFLDPTAAIELPAGQSFRVNQQISPPPDSAHGWQFVSRAAFPPRAPSFAS